MIPIGYMYKQVDSKPEWLKTDQVEDIFSVSSYISDDFDDWINYWKHNGYWFFNSPAVIESIARDNAISLAGMQLFYYQAYEKQWNEKKGAWTDYQPDNYFETNVIEPVSATLVGYDVVSFSAQSNAECSPLSCNHLAEKMRANSHCLLSSLDEAKELLESGQFTNCEAGPYRIFAVYQVQNA